MCAQLSVIASGIPALSSIPLGLRVIMRRVDVHEQQTIRIVRRQFPGADFRDSHPVRRDRGVTFASVQPFANGSGTRASVDGAQRLVSIAVRGMTTSTSLTLARWRTNAVVMNGMSQPTTSVRSHGELTIAV